MDLVVAEKPSVARDIARVLGVSTRGNGFFEGPSQVVTWCIGHLVEFEEPAHYNPRWKTWCLDTLPMIPERFALRAVEGTRKQWSVVKRLLRDGRFTRVINACDAGREGELIFRHCYELARSRLPVMRLWVSALTDGALRTAFTRLTPGARYDALAEAAQCRAEADWLVGLNATRALTLRARAGSGTSGLLLSVGRVQTPTLAMVVDRERAIRTFVPRDYWEVNGDFRLDPNDPRSAADGCFRGRWERDRRSALATRALAEALVARASCASARVERVLTRAQRVPPPLLFDLTTLQRRANACFAWSAQRTLDLAQALYETHKLITYPRTDARHLSEDLRRELPAIFDALATVPSYASAVASVRSAAAHAGKRVFDDKRVGDHHAIVPTARRPDLRQLNPDEAKLYDLVARSFLGVFMPDAEFELTTIVVRVGEGADLPIAVEAPEDDAVREEENPSRFLDVLPPPPDDFIARGRVRKVAGWQEFVGSIPLDDRDVPRAPQALPALQVGDLLMAHYHPAKKTTQPPRRYTEATLLGAMESCGKDVTDDELRMALKESGLGTPATRAAILETLFQRAYLARQGKVLAPTPMGEALVAAIPVPALRSAELTGRWEARLARMARGQERREDFMRDVVGFVHELVDAFRRGTLEELPRQPVSSPPPAATRAPEAPRALPRTAHGHHAPRASRGLPSVRARGIRREGAPARPGTDTDIPCPVCARATLVWGNRAWGCARWREGCHTAIPYEFGGRRITLVQLRALATKGRTRSATWTLDGMRVKGHLRFDTTTSPPSLTLERTGSPHTTARARQQPGTTRGIPRGASNRESVHFRRG